MGHCSSHRNARLAQSIIVALDEVYKHLLYIETALKPRIANIVPMMPTSFFAWERYVRSKGKAGKPWVFDTVPVGIALVALVIAIVLAAARRTPGECLPTWDIVGLVLTGVALLLVLRVRKSVRASGRSLDEACT